ncbi:MAG: hypothetical protein ABF651_12250 [Sporolactobacillus sp.]
MQGTIKLHTRLLADWLSTFAKQMNSGRFERALSICRQNHIWDYHTSKTGMNANVEDIHAALFQVQVEWKASAEGDGEKLPDPRSGLSFHCSCGVQDMPCAHAAAVVLYRILAMDRGQFGRGISIRSGLDDSGYQRLLGDFQRLSVQSLPAYQQFDPAQLHRRPDFQQTVEHYSRQIIESFVKESD